MTVSVKEFVSVKSLHGILPGKPSESHRVCGWDLLAHADYEGTASRTVEMYANRHS